MTVDPGIVLNFVLLALSTALAIVTKFAVSNSKAASYAAAVTTAASAAEKAVDKFAYTDQGQLNASRVDMAILVLSKLIPNFNDAQARADIQETLAVIHTHANMANGPVDLAGNIDQLGSALGTLNTSMPPAPIHEVTPPSSQLAPPQSPIVTN